MNKNYDIEILNIKPESTILLKIKQGCDFDTAKDIFDAFKKQYPNNEVIAFYEGYCDIEVKNENIL